MKRNISNVLLSDGIFLLLLAILYVVGDMNSILLGKILIFIAIFSSIQLISRYKQEDYLVIFFIFSILYWIYLIPYYFFGIPYHYLLEFQTIQYTNIIVFLQVLMLRLMFFGIRPNNLKIPREVFSFRNNSLIYYGAIVILVIMLPITLATNPPNLSGNYSLETKSSSWFEYSIIFIIIAGVYSSTKLKQILLISISIIYIFMPLLYGKRLAFLMLSLTVFNLFFAGKFKLKQILFLAIVGFLFVRVFAGLRVGIENMNILQFLLGVTDKGIMSNNQGGVVVCTTTYYGLIQQDVFDIVFRVKSFIGTFTGIFLPSSLNFDEAYVNLVAMEVSNIPGNGGFSSIYLYIWGGLIGVVLGSLIFNFLIRKSSYSRLAAIYFIFVLATFPRWYAYNMFILLKMGFWLMFFLAAADTFNKYSRRIISK
jgi:hypothetical protein